MSEENSEKDLFQLGLKIRREVLGDDYVDAALAAGADFNGDFQRYVTSSAWGAVWGRDTLSKRDRSLITICQLAALGHHEELALHIRAIKNTGLSREDVKEVLIQVAVYSGVPAANSAYRVANKVFKEIDDLAQ